uniref:NADH-ubiquinone oxidoreductase chain 2 n=1 Tax=Trachytettix bufo TaxID=1260748 RepID=M4JDS8_9ORTH|nr:NADH dehydrogenase subunit 2 [Trachytettix bufo]
MKKSPSLLLFTSILMMSTMISLTANTWLGVWMGMEINLMSFIPMISCQSTPNMKMSSIKYFIVQAVASVTLIMSFTLLSMNMYYTNNMIICMIMTASIMMKMGAAPLHFWFPEVMDQMNWTNCMILMTWQKIAPMVAIYYLQPNNLMMSIFIITSAIVGAIMGMNQISLKLIMAYSSINHIGWLLASIYYNMITFMWYILIYITLTIMICLMLKSGNINSINEMFMNMNQDKINKLNMTITMLSLGGMPPLIGFLPKWILIQEMMIKSSFLIVTVLIISSTISLYYYMKMFLSAGLMSMKENKWNLNDIKKSKIQTIMMYINMMSTLGLTISPIIIF